jgi:trimethylamine--corrinoid protein Co-methyltransferase
MERTNTFCPVQAVLDDAHIGMLKKMVTPPAFTGDKVPEFLGQIRRVMGTSHKLFTRFVRSTLRSGEIASAYPFESGDMKDETLLQASQRMQEILALPPRHIEKNIVDRVFQETPSLLTRLKNS